MFCCPKLVSVSFDIKGLGGTSNIGLSVMLLCCDCCLPFFKFFDPWVWPGSIPGVNFFCSWCYPYALT